MAIASDSSPLIALARIKRLGLLKELYKEVVIPPAVKVECVDKGKAFGAQDAYEIERGIAEGWIKVLPLQRAWVDRVKRMMQRAEIGPGEAEALIVAKEKGVPVILDDAEARAIARSSGLEFMGTLMVPYEAFVGQVISYKEFVGILTDLSKVLWVSPAVIAEMFRRAEEMRK